MEGPQSWNKGTIEIRSTEIGRTSPGVYNNIHERSHQKLICNLSGLHSLAIRQLRLLYLHDEEHEKGLPSSREPPSPHCELI